MESARRTLSRTERCRQAGTSGGDAFEEIAAEVREGLAALVGGRAVHISVEDVVAGLGDGTRTVR